MSSVLSEARFHNEEAAFAYVESKLWPDGPYCPHCGECERIGRLNGSTTRIGLRKCYACRKPFTVRIGTIFESSHAPLRIWLQAMHLMCSSKKGISTRQLQRTLGVGMKTAWFLGHRIRAAMDDGFGGFDGPVGGLGKTVEADEMYLGKSPKTRRFEGERARMVVSLVERDGPIRSMYLDDRNVRLALSRHLDFDSRLVTDGSTIYDRYVVRHESVDHSKGEYARGDVHTQTLEGFFSIFKRGLVGVYQHIDAKHLNRYLAEFDFRMNNRVRLGIDDVQRTANTIKGARGKRLTYRPTGRSAGTAGVPA
ncbi:MAG TPA: IS1595 family transposase [Caulobacteraceae bacterium]|nr:IS1595 family transposase [Caulobacteraceae bacterium]